MLKDLLKLVSRGGQTEAERSAKLYRDLMRHEAKIGGELFGPVQEGGRREFFCLDEHTWIWHEEWKDKTGSNKVLTTRYDVRPNGILKSQNGNNYKKVKADETKKLYEAAKIYKQRVSSELYSAVSLPILNNK